jgi:hypothetical protein
LLPSALIAGPLASYWLALVGLSPAVVVLPLAWLTRVLVLAVTS